MKDPNYPRAGNFNLAFRIRLESLPLHSERSISNTQSDATETIAAETVMLTDCKLMRWPSKGVDAFSGLSTTATILLFTPVLVPARERQPSFEKDNLDPFETFGRALSVYHKRIRQVPYVPKTGYTETHAAFLSQADAIITLVCEPEWDKDQSVLHQMEFAEAALDAVECKEANASNTLVLVQCGRLKHRIQPNASFRRVIEVDRYDEEVAKHLAQAIFCAEC